MYLTKFFYRSLNYEMDRITLGDLFYYFGQINENFSHSKEETTKDIAVINDITV